jgi:hypothetical protein
VHYYEYNYTYLRVYGREQYIIQSRHVLRLRSTSRFPVCSVLYYMILLVDLDYDTADRTLVVTLNLTKYT